MPFEADPGKAADSPMTYGEHTRKMSAVHKLYDAAVKRGESIAKLESDLAEASAKLSNMPDAAKAAKRLEKAELAAADWQQKHETYVAESTTKEVMLTLGITDTEDEDQAYMRWQFERSGETDFTKFAPARHASDTHFRSADAAPTPESAVDPAAAPAARPAPVRTNGGITPPPKPGAVRDRSWLAAQPNAWKNDRSNWKEIDLINGIEPRS